MVMIHRRHFLRSAGALALAMPGLGGLAACNMAATDAKRGGPRLVSDQQGWLDLPPGFSYTRFSLTGDIMSDGFRVPAAHDGMGAFAVEGDPDRCILIRNHEVKIGQEDMGPFADPHGPGHALSDTQIYDRTLLGQPLGGGTTTLIYNLMTRQLERSWLSLAGTERNCSGGTTPWGSWLTCEESRKVAGDGGQKDHGYVFEVPASAQSPVEAVPLKDMGRFNHEAVAVDPATSIVYQTEDEARSLIYRFLPNQPGRLAAGGRLQALCLANQASADTRNWGEVSRLSQGVPFAVRWIDMDDVTSPNGDLAERGHRAGAALFARGEGLAWAEDGGRGSVYFACTSGGPAHCGQIWKYIPSAFEGTDREADAPGQLVLHFESPARSTLDMCDNIVASPWGHLVICEDGHDEQFVRGLTADGGLYKIARNPDPANSEFAGACFAPDGQTLFVNVQRPGVTYAITGPWDTLSA